MKKFSKRILYSSFTAPSTAPKLSDYKLQKAKNIEENKKLFTEMFGDSVWGEDGPRKGKGKGKGKGKSAKSTQCVLSSNCLCTSVLSCLLYAHRPNKTSNPTLNKLTSAIHSTDALVIASAMTDTADIALNPRTS